MAAKVIPLLDRRILRRAAVDAAEKLHPASMVRNPVMFVTEVGAAITTLYFFSGAEGESIAFGIQISLWLWFTVLFANFAEALAEGRGKAQADALRKTRTKTMANLLSADGKSTTPTPSERLRAGDVVAVSKGELIPADGEIIQGIASVDESAITGESAPVIREAGGDRSAVTGGTRVLSDRIVVKVTANPGESFLDRMIGLVEGAQRQKTPNEIALTILLSALTVIFLVVVITLHFFGIYSKVTLPVTVLVALLVCGAYPLFVWVLAQGLFPFQSGGSLIRVDGVVVGSDLIGQMFAHPKYFHPRPSAAGAGYDATRSGGSNLGPTSKKLVDEVTQRVAAYREDNGLAADHPIPADAVTASGSCLDPHISVKNALLQAHRVATARGVTEYAVKSAIVAHTEGRDLGVLGEPRVNVLRLNLSLDGKL